MTAPMTPTSMVIDFIGSVGNKGQRCVILVVALLGALLQSLFSTGGHASRG